MSTPSNITPLPSAGSASDAQQEMFEFGPKRPPQEPEGTADMLIISMINHAMTPPVFVNDKAAIKDMAVQHITDRYRELQHEKHEVLVAASPLLITNRNTKEV